MNKWAVPHHRAPEALCALKAPADCWRSRKKLTIFWVSSQSSEAPNTSNSHAATALTHALRLEASYVRLELSSSSRLH